MGNLFARVWEQLFGDKEVKIVIIGLDNAGKTTTLYKLYVLCILKRERKTHRHSHMH